MVRRPTTLPPARQPCRMPLAGVPVAASSCDGNPLSACAAVVHPSTLNRVHYIAADITGDPSHGEFAPSEYRASPVYSMPMHHMMHRMDNWVYQLKQPLPSLALLAYSVCC